MQEYLYLANKLPNTTSFWLFLSSEYTKKIWDLKGKESKKKIFYQEQLNNYFQKAFEADNQDLFPYYYYKNSQWSSFVGSNFFKSSDQISQEYCQKALEQRQWDHIYYMTNPRQIYSAHTIIDCLDPKKENFNTCYCEVLKLVVGHWPNSVLYNSEFLNPEPDEYDGKANREYQAKISNQLKEAIKKYAK